MLAHCGRVGCAEGRAGLWAHLRWGGTAERCGGEVCATSLPKPPPNKGVQATASSLRSCLAAASSGA